MAKKQDKDNETTLPADIASEGALPVIPPGDVAGTEQTADSECELARLLAVPHGDVVIRAARGPDGIDPILGAVQLGRIYTTDFATALRYCEGPNPRFEPVLNADRTRFEAARQEAATKAARKAELEKQIAEVEAVK